MTASPGPLSKAHAFLEKECGACHTPNKGTTAVACMSCHASDAPLLARQVDCVSCGLKECRGCHIEHQGQTIRPTVMDHEVLARIGWGKGADPARKGTPCRRSHIFWPGARARIR